MRVDATSIHQPPIAGCGSLDCHAERKARDEVRWGRFLAGERGRAATTMAHRRPSLAKCLR